MDRLPSWLPENSAPFFHLRGVADRSGSALDCAQLERRTRQEGRGTSCALGAPSGPRAAVRQVWRHEKPARTRCLTSVGSMPVLPSEFLNPYSRRSQSSLLLLAAARRTPTGIRPTCWH